jgi:hypothetical protein
LESKVTKEITGNEAYEEALRREPPNPTSGIAFYLYACCILGFFCSTMNGYDGSLFNSLMENNDFLITFGGKNQVSLPLGVYAFHPLIMHEGVYRHSTTMKIQILTSNSRELGLE